MKLTLKGVCKSSIGLLLAGVAACGGRRGGGGGLVNNPTYSLGGTVAGLHGTGLTLANGTVRLVVAADGAFTFATPLANGAAYAVTVDTQPSNPAQACTGLNSCRQRSRGPPRNADLT